MKLLKNVTVAAALTAVSIQPMAAHADTLDVGATIGRMALYCFSQPQRTDFGGIRGQIEYAGKLALYQRNQNDLRVCGLGENEVVILATAAELSKFSVLEVGGALNDIQSALDMKSDEMGAFLERAKAMHASEIDYDKAYQQLAVEAARIQAFNADNGEFAPSLELVTQIRKAEARLEATMHYTAQTAGAAAWVTDRLARMSPDQKKAVALQASNRYGVKGFFVDRVGALYKGLGQSFFGTVGGVQKLSKAKAIKSMPVPKAVLESEYKLTEAKAEAIIAAAKSGGPI